MHPPPDGSTAPAGASGPQVHARLLAAIVTNDAVVARRIIESGEHGMNEYISWKYRWGGEDGEGDCKLRTPAMLAAYYGSMDVLACLLSLGAEANGRSPDDGATPLHCAAEGGGGCAEVIALLLQCGADRDALDNTNRRPADLLKSAKEVAPPPPISDHSSAENSSEDFSSDEGKISDLDKPEFATDNFRIFSFKVAKCTNSSVHDWTECPFVHPGEKARRRDPKKFLYSATACPDFRKGACRRGDLCPFAHGVFECWLHPARYKTTLCRDGPNCCRRVCFFAHTESDLRQPSQTPLPPEMANLSPEMTSSEQDQDSYDGELRTSDSGGGSPLSDPVAAKRQLYRESVCKDAELQACRQPSLDDSAFCSFFMGNNATGVGGGAAPAMDPHLWQNHVYNFPAGGMINAAYCYAAPFGYMSGNPGSMGVSPTSEYLPFSGSSDFGSDLIDQSGMTGFMDAAAARHSFVGGQWAGGVPRGAVIPNADMHWGMQHCMMLDRSMDSGSLDGSLEMAAQQMNRISLM